MFFFTVNVSAAAKKKETTSSSTLYLFVIVAHISSELHFQLSPIARSKRLHERVGASEAVGRAGT